MRCPEWLIFHNHPKTNDLSERHLVSLNFTYFLETPSHCTYFSRSYAVGCSTFSPWSPWYPRAESGQLWTPERTWQFHRSSMQSLAWISRQKLWENSCSVCLLTYCYFGQRRKLKIIYYYFCQELGWEDIIYRTWHTRNDWGANVSPGSGTKHKNTAGYQGLSNPLPWQKWPRTWEGSLPWVTRRSWRSSTSVDHRRCGLMPLLWYTCGQCFRYTGRLDCVDSCRQHLQSEFISCWYWFWHWTFTSG